MLRGDIGGGNSPSGTEVGGILVTRGVEVKIDEQEELVTLVRVRKRKFVSPN